jgi:hypothetical protein
VGARVLFVCSLEKNVAITEGFDKQRGKEREREKERKRERD